MINQNIKTLREEHLKLSRENFANEVGLKRTAIYLIETGQRNPSERTINDICARFNVNKEWLTTGEGDIFIENEIFSLDKYAKENNMTDLEIEIFKRFLSFDVETRTSVIEFINKTFVNTLSSSALETAPQSLVKQNVNDTEFATVEEAEEAYKKSRLNSVSKTTLSVSPSIKGNENLKVVK
ncbi:helix-turn-helix domain-containing protein [Turicibacter sanguinis]|uniref:helix-turn-helix domain-containing protein n=1 Tax=Turicibacter sanguinis TaxID=154288 RepID=UPI0018AC4BCC|nr:helix-turn-helix transcriptional regulator [Turicibacter sanguinis]MDB8552949.1 helix-turn-helix transcriptional regulator [Turicibacter sanguinis]